VLTFFIAGLLYLCASEHVDNLGAYTASRPETGLLIPSDCDSDLVSELSFAPKMLLSRLTLGRVVVAWLVFLWCAGLVLPSLDSHAQVNPAVKAIVAAGFATLLVGTPIALATYFNRAWRRVGTAPNRTAYVVWLSLESMAGIGALGILVYATVTVAVARFR
jgi:hypothetical protein